MCGALRVCELSEKWQHLQKPKGDSDSFRRNGFRPTPSLASIKPRLQDRSTSIRQQPAVPLLLGMHTHRRCLQTRRAVYMDVRRFSRGQDALSKNPFIAESPDVLLAQGVFFASVSFDANQKK